MALCERDFDEFDRGDAPDIELTTLTSYRTEWTYPVAFPPREPEATLAEVLSREGIRQLHVAETEKYAHVTYFFNGGREQEWEGEEHRLVDSPRDVATYDERPEMSAEAAAREFSERWSSRRLPVRDHQLRQRRHGRAHRQHPRRGDRDRGRRRVPRRGRNRRARVRRRLHRDGGPRQRRAHARAGRVPEHGALAEPGAALVTVAGLELADGGILADVTPTALALLGLEQPGEMTGRSLIS